VAGIVIALILTSQYLQGV